MKLPRLRFTVKWMMVAVAITGVIAALGERTVRFRQIAGRHERMSQTATIHSFDPITKTKVTSPIYMVLTDPKTGSPFPCPEQWHHEMAVKYEYAARHPWLPVDPDPPMPK
jgi:hypothetical protein